MAEHPLHLPALAGLAHLGGDDLGATLGTRRSTIEPPLDACPWTTMSTPAAQSGTVGGSNQATGTLAVPALGRRSVTSKDSNRLPDANSRRTGSLDKRPCKKTTFI